MKKTIVTSLVAVAALGFSGTSFAGGSISNIPVFNPEYTSTSSSVDNDTFAPELFSHNTSTSTFAPTSTSTVAPVFAPVNASTNIDAAPFGPAAGGDMTIYAVAPIALTVSPTNSLQILPNLTSMVAQAQANPADGSGNANALAGLALNPQATGGDTGDVNPSATAGSVSIGNISPDLSTSATSLIVIGGGYNVAP